MVLIMTKEEEISNKGNDQARAHQYLTRLLQHANHKPHQAQDPVFFSSTIIGNKNRESSGYRHLIKQPRYDKTWINVFPIH